MHRTNRQMVLQAAVAAAALTLVPALGQAQELDAPGRPSKPLMQAPRTHQDLEWSRIGIIRPQKPGGKANSSRWKGDDLGSWSVATNWDPNAVPNSTADTALFNNLGGGSSALLDINVSLGTLNLNDPQGGGVSSIDAGSVERNTTLTMGGASTIDVSNFIPDVPGIVFGGATGQSFYQPGVQVDAVIAGSAGLNKTGDGPLFLTRANTYTGNTTISGGRVTIEEDSGFGAAAGNLSLNNATVWVDASWTTARSMTIGANGGSIELLGGLEHSGNISGTGTLMLRGLFTTSIANFTTPNSLTGAVVLNNPTTSFSGNGAFASASDLITAGSLTIDHTNAGVNHLKDTAHVTLQGSSLTVRNTSGAALNEQTGSITLGGGFSIINLAADGGAATSLTAASLDRGPNRGGIKFQGNNLGQAPGGGNTNIFFTTAPTLVKGLIPYAWANGAADQSTALPETPDNTLVTYTANGVTPLAVGSYSNTLAGSTSNTNVRLDASAAAAANTNVNSLVLAPDFSNIDGITVSGGPINVDSGAVLSGHAGFTGGGAINSQPGNTISANLNFGAREAVFMCPSALTQTGVISGSGGLTKLGGRTMFFNGANTYTGQTTLTGFIRYNADVLANGTTPGPFGLDTGTIVLYSGSTTEINVGSGQPNGAGAAIFALDAVPGDHVVNRPLSFRGPGGALVRNFGTGVLTFNGPIEVTDGGALTVQNSGTTGSFVFNGNISGDGTLDTLGSPTITLNGNNSFARMDLITGFINLGSNTALGAGTVSLLASTTLVASGAARTLANPFVLYSQSTLTIGGSNPLTLSGTVDLAVTAIVNATSTATTTFSGNVTRGDLFKLGPGTLVLSGNNTLDGTVNVGSGTASGGMVILRSNGAAGSDVGGFGANAGGTGNTVAVDGGVTIGAPGAHELMVVRGDGVGSLGGLRSLTGANAWNGDVLVAAQYQNTGTTTVSVFANHGAIGVDAGSSLDLSGAVLADDLGASNGTTTVFLAPSIGIAKVGAGTLIVGSTVATAGETPVANISISGNGTVSGSLDIQAGMIKLKANSGAATLSAGKSVMDVAALNIAGGPNAPTAKLDLTTNSAVIDYTGAVGTLVNDTRLYIKNGGIVSSSADGTKGLGYADNAILGKTNLLGDPVDADALLIKYTYFGDTNLDGQVDVIDLGNLATAWQTANVWTGGDSNYDGFVDVIDLGLLATNWQAGVGNPLGPGSLDQALASYGLPNVTVPEPGIVGILGIAALGLLGQRRRRQ